jgi:tRNA (cmo5U34)-methyltransferase
VPNELPTVSLVGVDGSPPMLELARERLAPFGERFVLAQADFETITPADLRGGPFSVAVGVQSLHNSSDEGKKRALDAVHAVLAHGGLFLLLDRVRLVTPALLGAYRSVWEALGSAFNSQQRESGTFVEHVRSVAERGDKPGSLEQNLLWLREAGFDEVAVLYAVGVRALIAAVVR